MEFVPLWVTTLTTPPVDWPYSASKPAVLTWSCATAFRKLVYEYVTGGVAGAKRRSSNHTVMRAPMTGSHVRHRGGGGGAGGLGLRFSGPPGVALLV